jgi:hypothetical protein
MVPESSWVPLSQNLRDIAESVLGAKINDPRFEFHGHQLWGGTGPWRGIDRADRMMIYRICLELLNEHQIVLCYGRANKKLLKAYPKPMHPHEVSFWLCLEQCANHLNASKELGFLVADECSQDLKKIARKGLAEYRETGPRFGRPTDISRIIDTVHFMNSVTSPHLQMCDLCMFIIRRFQDRSLADPDDDLIEFNATIRKRTRGARTFPYTVGWGFLH